MTLDETIKHCEEKAKELRLSAERCKDLPKTMRADLDCAEEHEQLAEWLKELQELRDFVRFVCGEVVDDAFKEDADCFAEVVCRKLVKLGYVELDGDAYKVKEKKND